mgnify:CR=1 FL=1
MNPLIHLVFMGVSGCGKTTAAELAADLTGWPYAEADEFHPQANIDKMASGHPLDDDDRRPWLEAMRDWMTDRATEGTSAGTVVTCSALKRSYRDILRGAEGRVVFVHLYGEASVIEERLAHRKGHFMPASLLPSQYADLEQLQDDEDGVTVDLARTPREIVDAGLAHAGIAPSQSESDEKDA